MSETPIYDMVELWMHSDPAPRSGRGYITAAPSGFTTAPSAPVPSARRAPEYWAPRPGGRHARPE